MKCHFLLLCLFGSLTTVCSEQKINKPSSSNISSRKRSSSDDPSKSVLPIFNTLLKMESRYNSSSSAEAPKEPEDRSKAQSPLLFPVLNRSFSKTSATSELFNESTTSSNTESPQSLTRSAAHDSEIPNSAESLEVQHKLKDALEKIAALEIVTVNVCSMLDIVGTQLEDVTTKLNALLIATKQTS